MRMLRMLGAVNLTTADGGELDALLRQPKAVAVLAYLAMPRPGTWHRRDALLAAFWPEFEQSRARTSLRNALYTLRKHLDEGTIRTRGDDEVSIDPALLETDVAAMLDHAAANRHVEAVAEYRGELLPAFYVVDAAGFHEWLDHERSRLRETAKLAAASAATARELAGDVTGAVEMARRGVAIDPNDETATRRLIAALDASGDRAQALLVYERFREHLHEAFGVPPSDETRTLVEGIRNRVSTPAPSALASFTPASSAPASFAATIPAVVVEQGHEVSPVSFTAPLQPGGRRRRFAWLIVAALIVAGTGLTIAVKRAQESMPVRRSLVVLPMENATGNPQLDYVSSGVAENVARRLDGVGDIAIKSAARSEWPTGTARDARTVARSFSSDILLRSRLVLRGDSLEVEGWVVDVASSAERRLPRETFTMTTLPDVESRLAASVAAAIFRPAVPQMPRGFDRTIHPESHRLTLQAWHELLSLRRPEVARQHFTEATLLDPSNARAWAGLSSAISAQVGQSLIPFDEGFEMGESAANHALAIDSLQGSALANLAMLRAFKYRNLDQALALMRRAKIAEPANPEVYQLESALYRLAWRWDEAVDAIRVAGRMDPLSPAFLQREAGIAMCAGRPEVALALLDRQQRSDPTLDDANERSRVLARLGRYTEAMAALDTVARSGVKHNRLSRGAKGDSVAYWELRRAEGEQRVRALSTKRFVSAQTAMLAHFAAGDTVEGFAALELALARNDLIIARLPCQRDFDAVRSSEHFQSVIRRAGRSPIR